MIVRCRRGRIVEEPAESSDSDSPESSDSEDEESLGRASVELRAATGALWNDEPEGRRWEASNESDLDGGRKSTGEGVGEFAALRLAAISRNAATDILCDESDAALLPRGRGMAGGTSVEGDSEDSGEGDSGRTCRKDLRLKDSVLTSTLSEGGVSDTFDFLRSRCAHEKRPPCFLGAERRSPLVRATASPGSCALWCGCGSLLLGNDLVESALFGSPYVENRSALVGGRRRESRSASERELGEVICGGRRRECSATSEAGVDLLRKPR